MRSSGAGSQAASIPSPRARQRSSRRSSRRKAPAAAISSSSGSMRSPVTRTGLSVPSVVDGASGNDYPGTGRKNHETVRGDDSDRAGDGGPLWVWRGGYGGGSGGGGYMNLSSAPGEAAL